MASRASTTTERSRSGRARSGTATEPIVSVKNVYKIFGPRPQEALKRIRSGAERSQVSRYGTAAVIDASFDVYPGEIFVVMGLSGSGKSTLIRTLNGLWDATAGSVKVGGVDLAEADKRQLREVRAKRVSMVFQHFALLPHRSNLENAAYPLEIQGVDKAERQRKARQALELVGLKDWVDHYPSELSGGMQQRVGLARALAADTDVLLMDEAFSALDPMIRREMQDQLIDLQQQLGKTIVFITHDLNEAMRIGDRIAIMRNGEIVQIGTAEEILSRPATEYVTKFVADVDKSKVISAGTVARPVRGAIPSTTGPTRARVTMAQEHLSAVYVLDRARHLLGYVIDEEVVAADARGAMTLDGLIHTDAYAVTADTVLSEVLAPSASSRLPLAVVDDDGVMVGVIPRAVLLSSMVPSEAPRTGPIHLPTGPITLPNAEQLEDAARRAGSATDEQEGTSK